MAVQRGAPYRLLRLKYSRCAMPIAFDAQRALQLAKL
jgi:hypothetical protein